MNNIRVSTNLAHANLKDNIKNLNSFKGSTILAVDDDLNILFLITEIFESCGIKVITADNALEAFEAIEQFQLDLLISDINMPGKSGYWLIQKVRTLTPPKKRKIPAIAFTGNTDAHNEAIAFGYQTYIQKPRMGELVTETARLLRRSIDLLHE
ncbi:response regulator [uncultured Nostoc sp.]|uniref:response regulator n=1 Tax=uncultured Nostoc sp. TaxID=340711 RepID=UPI0035CB184E